MESHYEVLGLSPSADEAEVRRAYRTLLKEHHPDQGGSRERFLRIKEAYEAILGRRPPEGRRAAGRAISRRGGDGTARSDRPTYDPDDVDLGVPDHETLTVGGDYLTLTLAALVHGVSLEALVDGSVSAATDRTVAFFRVANASSEPLVWRGEANTSFIGDDGFLYEGSSIVAPHADRLPARWCSADVEIPPGRALDAVVIAQEMPADVAVEKVLYTQHAPDSAGDDTERYLFELRPLVRERLNRLPFRN